ncbi:MAG: GNAT family N-acetyltransferase [Planctomycetes bacterium]|nr:GNAT family N-acetyltransferase [Planctomycetota bacterium]
MIGFDCFRNDDPPRLADAWRATDLGPRALQPMTSADLETAVFSKPYFDRRGLLVARDADRILGFTHVAFGPNADRTALDTAVGTTLLVVVPPHERRCEIESGLLARAEEYLRARGARTILGGGSAALGGFYLGLYGGSDLPGILDSSPGMQDVFRRAGYREAGRTAVLQRPLAGFRPPVNRLQLAIRRATTLRAIDEPARRSWWEAATTTGISLRRYELHGESDALLGSASFWDVQPLAASWGLTMTGLLRIDIEGPRRRQGLANFLVAEALHDLAEEGTTVVEAQVAEDNAPAMKLFSKLGFQTVDQGTVFSR